MILGKNNKGLAMQKTIEEVKKHVGELVNNKGLSFNSLSINFGKNPSYLQKFVKQDSPRRLDEDFRKKLARVLEVDEQELTDLRLDNLSVTPLAKLPDAVNIDMLDVSACCGTGNEVTTEPVIGTWQMPLVDFNAMSLTSPDNIKIIKAVGDSMTPTVQDGDYVFVDISNQYITSDGVYVLRLPTGLSIKRIQNGLSGDVTVRSDNPAYSPISAKLDDVRILGRVVRIMNMRKI